MERRLPPLLVINLDKQISSGQYAQGLAKLTWTEEFFKKKDQGHGTRADPPTALIFIPATLAGARLSPDYSAPSMSLDLTKLNSQLDVGVRRSGPHGCHASAE